VIKVDLQLDTLTQDLVLIPDERMRVDARPITGAERISQALGIRLRCWMGEWFLDQTHGVPYVDSVLGKQNPTVVTAVFRSQILSVEGVQRINNLELSIDPQTRALTVVTQASSKEGLSDAKVVIQQ
jgi:hypothetical protein